MTNWWCVWQVMVGNMVDDTVLSWPFQFLIMNYWKIICSIRAQKSASLLHLFYGSDSSYNLKQKFTKLTTNVISKFLQTYPSDDAYFYFCSDAMFVLACLDGSGELSPNSDSAWNNYVTDGANTNDPCWMLCGLNYCEPHWEIGVV